MQFEIVVLNRKIAVLREALYIYIYQETPVVY